MTKVNRLAVMKRQDIIKEYTKEKAKRMKEGRRTAENMYKGAAVDGVDFFQCYGYKVEPNTVNPLYLTGKALSVRIIKFALIVQELKNNMATNYGKGNKLTDWRLFLKLCTLYSEQVNHLDEETEEALDRINKTADSTFLVGTPAVEGSALLDEILEIYPKDLKGIVKPKRREKAVKQLDEILKPLTKPNEIALLSLACRIDDEILTDGVYRDFSANPLKPYELDLTHVADLLTPGEILSGTALNSCNNACKYEMYRTFYDLVASKCVAPENKLGRIRAKTSLTYTATEVKRLKLKRANQKTLPFKDDELKQELATLYRHYIGTQLAEIGAGVNETRRAMDKGRGILWTGKPEDTDDPLGLLKGMNLQATEKLHTISEEFDKGEDLTLYFSNLNFPVRAISREEYQQGWLYIRNGGRTLTSEEKAEIMKTAGTIYDKAEVLRKLTPQAEEMREVEEEPEEVEEYKLTREEKLKQLKEKMEKAEEELEEVDPIDYTEFTDSEQEVYPIKKPYECYTFEYYEMLRKKMPVDAYAQGNPVNLGNSIWYNISKVREEPGGIISDFCFSSCYEMDLLSHFRL